MLKSGFIYITEKKMYFLAPPFGVSGHEDGMDFIHPSLEGSGLEISASSAVQWGGGGRNVALTGQKQNVENTDFLETVSLVENCWRDLCRVVLFGTNLKCVLAPWTKQSTPAQDLVQQPDHWNCSLPKKWRL